MPTNTLRGDAQAIAKKQTITVGGSLDVNNTYTVTINRKEVTFTDTGPEASTDDVATELQTLLAASEEAEFQEITFTVDASVITLTAKEAGRPYTVAVSVTGTGTLTLVTTQESRGPNHWDDPDNWTAGWIPQGACDAPVQNAAVAAAGGSLTDATTFYWVITALNKNGETTASNEQSLTISTPNQTAILSWGQVDGATGYKIYRSTSAGSYGATSLVTTINAGSTVTYNDTGAALSAGSPPVANTAVGDDIYLTGPTSLLYGLDQSTIKPASLNVDASYSGFGGLPKYNGSYFEYRTDYIKLKAPPTVNFGYGVGAGTGLFKLDVGSSAAVTFNVSSTGSPTSLEYPALQLIANHASNVLNVLKGSVGTAVDPGTTSAFTMVRVGYLDSPTTDVDLRFGAGTTLTTINQAGGVLSGQSNVTTLTIINGTFTLLGSATLGTLNAEGGTVFYQSSGTLSTANLKTGAVLDFRRDVRARTVTTCVMNAGAAFYDPFKTVTVGGSGIQLQKCGLADVTIDLGRDITVQRS